MQARKRTETAALLILAAGLLIWVWSVAWRYDKIGDTTARTNRFTGEVQYLTFQGWQPSPDWDAMTPWPTPSAAAALPPTPRFVAPPAPQVSVFEYRRHPPGVTPLPRVNPFRRPELR